MKPNSNISFHARIGESLPKEYADLYVAERDYLQSNVSKDALVCDIWCWEWRSVDDLLGITKNIVWVDYDLECIERLYKKYEDLDTLEFICADCTDLPFEDDRFDVVVCMMSWLNFWDKKDKSLDEMKRIVKVNGKIILSVFSEDALPIRLKTYEKIWIKIKEIIGGKVIFDEDFGANSSEQFTSEELQIYFTNHQLEIAEIKKAGIWYICSITKLQ